MIRDHIDPAFVIDCGRCHATDVIYGERERNVEAVAINRGWVEQPDRHRALCPNCAKDLRLDGSGA